MEQELIFKRIKEGRDYIAMLTTKFSFICIQEMSVELSMREKKDLNLNLKRISRIHFEALLLIKDTNKIKNIHPPL